MSFVMLLLDVPMLKFSAELERLHYLQTLGSLFPTPIRHIIKREEMFDDVIKLYRNNPSVLSEHPFRVQFEEECAIDAGGSSGQGHVLWILVCCCYANFRWRVVIDSSCPSPH